MSQSFTTHGFIRRFVFATFLLFVVGLPLAAQDYPQRMPQRLPPSILESKEPPLGDGSSSNLPNDLKESGNSLPQFPKGLEQPGDILPTANMQPIPSSGSLTDGTKNSKVSSTQWFDSAAPKATDKPNPINQYGLQQVPPVVITLGVRAAAAQSKEKDLNYEIVAQNTSTMDAYKVLIMADLPKGTRLKQTKPEVLPGQSGLTWKFNSIKAGESKSISLSLLPEANVEEVNFVARVQFEQGVEVTTKLALPSLRFRKTAPQQILKNQPFTSRIEVTNNSQITVSNVLVSESLPAGVQVTSTLTEGIKTGQTKTDNGEYTWELDKIRPGETRIIDYKTVSQAIGEITSTLTVNSESIKRQGNWKGQCLDAALSWDVIGPANQRALMQTPIPYEIRVVNSGNAELTNVTVDCELPRDVKVMRQTANAQVFKDSVQWVIPKLRVGEEKIYRLTVQSLKEGTRLFGFNLRANPGFEFRKTIETDFYGLPALDIKTDGDGASSVGREITYLVTVNNRGAGPSRKTQLRVELPKNVEVSDPTMPGIKVTPTGVLYDAVDLVPNQDVKFTLKVRAVAPGEAFFRFFITAEHMSQQEPYRHEKMTAISGR